MILEQLGARLYFALDDFKNPPRFYVENVPTVASQGYDDISGPYELDRIERAMLAAEGAEIGELPVTLWLRLRAFWQAMRRPVHSVTVTIGSEALRKFRACQAARHATDKQ